MKRMNRMLALLLALSMLFALVGCTSEPEETTPPTTAPTEPPATEPPTDWVGLYTDAVTKLEEQKSLTLDVTAETVTTIAGKSFPSTTKYIAKYQGLGTDAFLARIEEDNTSGEYTYSIKSSYADGMIYATADDGKFSSPMEAEDLLAGYYPAALFTPENYETVTGDENDLTTVHFNGPIEPEKWLPQEDITITEAEGTAKLDDQGNLLSTQCTVSYKYGSADIETTVSVAVRTGEVTVKAPANPEEYHELENIAALWLLESSYGYMQYADTYSVTVLEARVSQAGGVALSSQTTYSSYNNDEYLSKAETNVHLVDYSQNGQTIEGKREESFMDGKFTVKKDDERPIVDKTMTQEKVITAMTKAITEALILPSDIETAQAYDMGSVILLEFTGTEEAGQAMCDSTSQDLFGQAGVLEELASAYETAQYDMWLSVDKYTQLPVSFGYEYTGKHTIYGQPYELINQHYESLDLASIDSYKAITEELAPETEPENKATPLFYHVTGPDGQEMWLLGTIHIGDERTGFLPQEIYDAFEASDALALECDVEAFDKQAEEDEEIQDQISELYYYSDGTTAKDHIVTEDLYEDAVRMLKATGNYNYNSEVLKVSIWGSSIDNFITNQAHTLTYDKGVEDRLTKLAHEQDKPIWEVESCLFQLGMETGYSDNLQEFLLYSSMASGAIDSWEGTQELYDLWCAGDEAALIERLNDDDTWEISEDDFDMEELTEEERLEVEEILAKKDEYNPELLKIQEEYTTSMESSRNAGMLEVAKGYLESGDVVFYAVGLAHLLAKDGLVNTLREAGYTVELVTYAK